MEELNSNKMLKQIDEAIYTIMVGGQSYTLGSRQLTRANLTELKNLRETLKAEVAAGADGLLANTFVGIFEGR